MDRQLYLRIMQHFVCVVVSSSRFDHLSSSGTFSWLCFSSCILQGPPLLLPTSCTSLTLLCLKQCFPFVFFITSWFFGVSFKLVSTFSPLLRSCFGGCRMSYSVNFSFVLWCCQSACHTLFCLQ